MTGLPIYCSIRMSHPLYRVGYPVLRISVPLETHFKQLGYSDTEAHSMANQIRAERLISRNRPPTPGYPASMPSSAFPPVPLLSPTPVNIQPPGPTPPVQVQGQPPGYPHPGQPPYGYSPPEQPPVHPPFAPHVPVYPVAHPSPDPEHAPSSNAYQLSKFERHLRILMLHCDQATGKTKEFYEQEIEAVLGTIDALGQ